MHHLNEHPIQSELIASRPFNLLVTGDLVVEGSVTNNATDDSSGLVVLRDLTAGDMSSQLVVLTDGYKYRVNGAQERRIVSAYDPFHEPNDPADPAPISPFQDEIVSPLYDEETAETPGLLRVSSEPARGAILTRKSLR